ncbi:MAG: hypothetical protein AAFZ11_11425 [Pseudomonadota bacterium]
MTEYNEQKNSGAWRAFMSWSVTFSASFFKFFVRFAELQALTYFFFLGSATFGFLPFEIMTFALLFCTSGFVGVEFARFAEVGLSHLKWEGEEGLLQVVVVCVRVTAFLLSCATYIVIGASFELLSLLDGAKKMAEFFPGGL